MPKSKKTQRHVLERPTKAEQSSLAGQPLPRSSFAATFWYLFLCQSWQRSHFHQPNIIKNPFNDLIAKQELPATAKNLTIITPRTSCIYFLPKIHFSCPTEVISSYLEKIMTKPYHHAFRTTNSHMKFFATLISLPNTMHRKHLISTFLSWQYAGSSMTYPTRSFL